MRCVQCIGHNVPPDVSHFPCRWYPSATYSGHSWRLSKRVLECLDHAAGSHVLHWHVCHKPVSSDSPGSAPTCCLGCEFPTAWIARLLSMLCLLCGTCVGLAPGLYAFACSAWPLLLLRACTCLCSLQVATWLPASLFNSFAVCHPAYPLHLRSSLLHGHISQDTRLVEGSRHLAHIRLCR